jgi:ATP-dependent RNA helicase DDX27
VQVDTLIRLSLHQPIRLFVDSADSIASNLTQEFIRIRREKEDDRPAVLLALATRSLQRRCIVFFRQKATAHRMKILFKLMGLEAAELHGNLTQGQVRFFFSGTAARFGSRPPLFFWFRSC